MKKNFTLVFFSSLLIYCLSSCQDQYDICDQPKDVFLKAGFYQVNGSIETAATVPAFTLSFLNAVTPVYDKQAGISKFVAPLNPSVASFEYLVQLSDGLQADTLRLEYTTQTINLSVECGNIFVYTLTNATSTTNSIDSVKLINTTVNTNNIENLKIYF